MVSEGQARHPHRYRTAARFLLRSLTLRGSSFLLALVAITTGATLTATMLNLRADLGAKMSRELRRYGPNLLVLPAKGSAVGGAAVTLDETVVQQILAALGVQGAAAAPSISPLLVASASVRDASQSAARENPSAATVVGTDFETLRRLYPGWRVDGAWPSPGARACLVGASLARRAGLAPRKSIVFAFATGQSGSDLGDAREMSTALEVTGIVSTGESEDEQVFVPLQFLQEQTGLSGRVSLAALAIDGGSAAVEVAARAIEAASPDVTARPLRPIAAAQGAILEKLGRMMALLTTVVLALSALCLTTTLMSIVIERESEIGLMRSIGADDGEILTMFLTEVSLLGVLGGLLGLALGALSVRIIGTRLFDAAIDPRAIVVPFVLGSSVLLCLISALLPLRRALRIQPAAALRGE